MLILWLLFLADRTAAPPREDLPLPTQPPYTAFIGNLAFDLTEIDLEEFFTGQKVYASRRDRILVLTDAPIRQSR